MGKRALSLSMPVYFSHTHTHTHTHTKTRYVSLGQMLNVLLISALTIQTIISHTMRQTHSHTDKHTHKVNASSLVFHICVNQIRVLHHFEQSHMRRCQNQLHLSPSIVWQVRQVAVLKCVCVCLPCTFVQRGRTLGVYRSGPGG